MPLSTARGAFRVQQLEVLALHAGGRLKDLVPAQILQATFHGSQEAANLFASQPHGLVNADPDQHGVGRR